MCDKIIQLSFYFTFYFFFLVKQTIYFPDKDLGTVKSGDLKTVKSVD